MNIFVKFKFKINIIFILNLFKLILFINMVILYIYIFNKDIFIVFNKVKFQMIKRFFSLILKVSSIKTLILKVSVVFL